MKLSSNFFINFPASVLNLPSFWRARLMPLNRATLIACISLLLGQMAFAQDMPGAQDHPALKRFAGSVIVSYDENGNYGHPDHVKVHQVVYAAAQRAGRPVCGGWPRRCHRAARSLAGGSLLPRYRGHR